MYRQEDLLKMRFRLMSALNGYDCFEDEGINAFYMNDLHQEEIRKQKTQEDMNNLGRR